MRKHISKARFERSACGDQNFGLTAAIATAVMMFGGTAEAWDNCGHGYRRNYFGYWGSNYGWTSDSPRGFHLGWNAHCCFPNW